MTATTIGSQPSGEPIDVTFTFGEPQDRLWGIPFFGWFARLILLIPHFIILWLYAFLVGLVVLVSWVPVLLNGRQADLVVDIIGGYLRWSLRIGAYLFLLTGAYPPFSPTGDYTVGVRIDPNVSMNRLWGIPLVGIWVRWILLIPHYIALFFLGIAVAVLAVFAWVPVLILGRQADPIVDFVGGVFRWSLRISAYTFLLTDRYPPFRLGS